jgi:peptidylprolyl isomerase
MSDRGRIRVRRSEPDWQNMTKAERRAAAKAAAARAAVARRRQRIMSRVLAVLVVAGLIAGAIWVFTRSKPKGTETASTATSASASAAASCPPAAPAAPVNAAFPPLPEGADPALKTKPATTAGTGELTKLNVTTLVEGKGPAVQSCQSITVNYVGVSYKDGKQFDASWDKSEAFTFQLGTGGVIKGWDQGLVGVKVGSRVQLDIPSDLAYGDTGNPGGPLRFIVDVLGAK